MNQPDTTFALPLIYDADYEVLEEDEAETNAELQKTLMNISETTFKHSGHATRSVHAKSHGLLLADIEIMSNLPPTLAQGMFAKPGVLPIVMRFSTVPGDILDDSVSTPRGLAIKIVGVNGERLEGSEGAITQDFVLVNGPAFLTPGARKFLTSLKLLASTTDKVPNLKKAFSAVLQTTEKALEAVGGGSPSIKAMGGHPETNLLGETYFSQVPILYGPYMAKISVAPVSKELLQLKDAPVDLTDRANGLREAVIAFFSNQYAVWELRVQLCTNLDSMPIEDASVVWPEEQSPYVTVARITAKPQEGWSDKRSAAVDDGMSFSPWHGITAHRPIGSIMRVRKMAYEMSARFRIERNQGQAIEPTSLDHLAL
jgi:catalase